MNGSDENSCLFALLVHHWHCLLLSRNPGRSIFVFN